MSLILIAYLSASILVPLAYLGRRFIRLIILIYLRTKSLC